MRIRYCSLLIIICLAVSCTKPTAPVASGMHPFEQYKQARERGICHLHSVQMKWETVPKTGAGGNFEVAPFPAQALGSCLVLSDAPSPTHMETWVCRSCEKIRRRLEFRRWAKIKINQLYIKVTAPARSKPQPASPIW